MAEAHSRVLQLMQEGDFGFPPEQLLGHHPKAILLGEASIEQRAIATLYGQVESEHKRTHRVENLPMGINPRVSYDHYRNHVMVPMLSELLLWSTHRGYPDITEKISILAVRFDPVWNIYAIPRSST